MPPASSPEVVLSVAEIRDYRTIHDELVRHLDQGFHKFRLTGTRGHRLLVSGLAGPWSAVIEIFGDAGPELVAGMDAPGVTVVCHGSIGDGGASGLKSGRMLVFGTAGPAFGYALRGGLAMAVGEVGARAGLRQSGGDLILLGRTGPMAGERQLGGRILAHAEMGPHAGRGRRGGRLIRIDAGGGVIGDHDDRAAMDSALAAFAPWLGTSSDRTPQAGEAFVEPGGTP